MLMFVVDENVRRHETIMSPIRTHIHMFDRRYQIGRFIEGRQLNLVQ